MLQQGTSGMTPFRLQAVTIVGGGRIGTALMEMGGEEKV